MRTARIKAEGAGYYHCMSRIIERRMALGKDEKDKFRKLMRLVAEFCEVKVLTWSCLDNHWHLLLYVPERREVSDKELIKKLKLIYDKPFVKEIEQQLKDYREDGQDYWADELKERYTYRMFDLSEFMKMLKQRYTQWYNRRAGRKGTLWEERFKSLLIEGSEHALSTMAAYIDLNAVRAGIVSDPKDYRYCGYGEAVAGVKEAKEGLKQVMLDLGQSGNWTSISRTYRKYLYESGGAKGIDEDGRSIKAGFSRQKVEKVLAEGGRLSRMELLRCRVRYFSDGVALGRKEFVERVFKEHRKDFGLKRKTGARAMRRGDWGGLCTMRDLRMQVISVSQRT